MPERRLVGQVATEQFIATVSAQDDLRPMRYLTRQHPDRQGGRIGQRIVRVSDQMEEVTDGVTGETDLDQRNAESACGPLGVWPFAITGFGKGQAISRREIARARCAFSNERRVNPT